MQVRTYVRYNEQRDRGLRAAISEAAAHIHAATAALVLEVAGFDERGGWRGEGMRGCEQWLSVAAGFDGHTSAEMLRVGHALAALPATRDAFSAGHLSFDKVRLLTHVATAEDEHIWLTVARDASAAQLGSICRAARRARAAEDPATATRQQAARRVAWWWRDEDGMLQLVASLPPEEGRIVISAFEAAEVRPLPARPGDDAEPEADPGPEVDHPHGARRADALVRVCEDWLAEAAASAPAERAPRLGAPRLLCRRPRARRPGCLTRETASLASLTQTIPFLDNARTPGRLSEGKDRPDALRGGQAR